MEQVYSAFYYCHKKGILDIIYAYMKNLLMPSQRNSYILYIHKRLLLGKEVYITDTREPNKNIHALIPVEDKIVIKKKSLTNTQYYNWISEELEMITLFTIQENKTKLANRRE